MVAAAIAIAVLAAGPVSAARPVPDGVSRAEVELAAETVRCDCGCHPQSVYDCACGRAEEMWGEIVADVGSGMTGAEVVAKYVAAKGDQILIAPKAEGFNLLAWLGPGAGLVLVAFGLVFVLRRWATGRNTAQAATDAGAVDVEIDPEYLDRLRRDVEELR